MEMTTVEELEAEAIAMMDAHIVRFKEWYGPYIADLEAFEQKLKAAPISDADREKIARLLLEKGDLSEDMGQ